MWVFRNDEAHGWETISPRRRGMPCHARPHREALGLARRRLHCGFCGKKWAGQGKQA